MKVIAIMSPKGGVGKTAAADSIAYILANMGKRVLLMDGDPQADSTRIFQKYIDHSASGMEDLLRGKRKITEVIEETEYERLDLIPTSGYLTETEIQLRMDGHLKVVREAIKDIEDRYDYIICDCGRIIDAVTYNFLLAADLLISPCKVGGFEVNALDALNDEMSEAIMDMNPNLQWWILLTMMQKNKTAADFEEWMRDVSGYAVFDTNIRHSVLAVKSTILRRPLPNVSKRGAITVDYINLTEEILEVLGEEEKPYD